MFTIKTDLNRMIKNLDRVKSEIMLQHENLPRDCATSLSVDIVENIMNQVFAAGYKPYSKKYEEWKKNTVGHLDFWRLYGDLISHISAFEGHGGWIAGITKGATNRDGESIEKYASVNEFLRPLFGLSREKFKDEKFPIIGKRALDRIREKWMRK